jgi:hypothetical protein
MIINNNIRYQTIDFKSKVSSKKPTIDIVSKPGEKDSYEPSTLKSPEKRSATYRPDIREDLISTVKKRINKGFYNSPEVLEDLGNSFANALQKTIF